MRPRKRIALYCADRIERSAITLVLDTRGYRVLIDSPVKPDLYVIVHGLLDAGRSANAYGKRVCDEYPEVPVVSVILGKSNLARPSYPSTSILWDPKMRELRETIRIQTARKRGPKKPQVELVGVR